MCLAEETIKTRCHPSCRTCANECSLLQKLKVGGFGLVELKETANDWHIPFSCTACKLCSVACNRKLSAAELMREWRAEIAASQAGLPAALLPRLTDNTDNVFAAYRQAFPHNQALPAATSTETIFFPGCALSSYMPELAHKSFEYLQTRYPDIGWLNDCCYDILDKIGLEDRYLQAAGTLTATVSHTGARRIITACATCHQRLRKIFPELEIISIYQLLADDRTCVPGLPERIAVHDSCADRGQQETGRAVRSLLPGVQKLKHEGKRSLCCGAGAGVNYTNPELAAELGRKRWQEVEESSAQILVTYCANCSLQLNTTRNGIPVKHILELVFSQPLDYTQISARIAHLSQDELHLEG